MRRTLRLFAAAVKPVSARYLEAGAPTGLTGLMTHGSPRSTLLYLYSSTLEKLQAAPEHSVYRQSVEAVTKHRMGLVEGVVPEGHAAWAARARDVFAQHPEQFSIAGGAHADGGATLRVERGGRSFVVRHVRPVIDERLQEWDGEIGGGQLPDEAVTRVPLEEQVKWEPEPQLTADQVSELENKIGAGLIEEVIQVAEGELKLVNVMLESKAWESLEEQPNEGQWVYFERKQ